MEYGMTEQNMNPYAVTVPQGVSMADIPRHESGNVSAANAEARVVSEVKAQVALAKQFPRDANASMERILKECQRPTLADAAVYAFPRGKEVVTGPSIRLAEVLARNWGNCTFGLEVLERNQGRSVGYSVVRAYAWDLETNTYISRQFEVKHWRQTQSGGYALKEDRDIYELEANMGSRRMRACILQMIPGDVTSAAVMACRRTSASGLSAQMQDEEKRTRLISGTLSVFEKMGITHQDLEEYLSARVPDWTADHMMKIKELKNGLDDGIIALGDAFPHLAGNERNAVITKDQVKELMELAKQSGKQGQISDALKKAGIAKFADIPADQFDAVKSSIEALIKYGTSDEADEAKDDKPEKSEQPETTAESSSSASPSVSVTATKPQSTAQKKTENATKTDNAQSKQQTAAKQERLPWEH